MYPALTLVLTPTLASTYAPLPPSHSLMLGLTLEARAHAHKQHQSAKGMVLDGEQFGIISDVSLCVTLTALCQPDSLHSSLMSPLGW
jgi:hypothetical protein